MSLKKLAVSGALFSFLNTQFAIAEELPFHAKALKILQSEPKEKQEEIVGAILEQYQGFSSKLKQTNLDMESSRAGTFLLDLSKEDWKYVKERILLYGLASDQNLQVDRARILVRKKTNETLIVDLSNVFNGSVFVNDKIYFFDYRYDLSVQKNDENIKKFVSVIERKEELLESETAFIDKMNRMFSWIIFPNASATSSNVGASLKSVSSSVGGLLRGFVSPVSTNRVSASGFVVYCENLDKKDKI